MARRLAHVPFGTRPTVVLVRAGTLQTLDMPGVLTRRPHARPRLAVVPARGAGRWALAALIADHASMASIARRLGVCWHTANTAVELQGKSCSNTTRCAGRAFG